MSGIRLSCILSYAAVHLRDQIILLIRWNFLVAHQRKATLEMDFPFTNHYNKMICTMMNGFPVSYLITARKEPNNEKPIIPYYSVTLQKERNRCFLCNKYPWLAKELAAELAAAWLALKNTSLCLLRKKTHASRYNLDFRSAFSSLVDILAFVFFFPYRSSYRFAGALSLSFSVFVQFRVVLAALLNVLLIGD